MKEIISKTNNRKQNTPNYSEYKKIFKDKKKTKTKNPNFTVFEPKSKISTRKESFWLYLGFSIFFKPMQ